MRAPEQSQPLFVLSILLVMLGLASSLPAQVSSALTGTLLDPAGLVIPGADIRLISDSTGAARSAVTDDRGNFVFNAVPPGICTLVIEAAGFKKYERTGIELTAKDSLSVGQIRMEVASLSDSVMVTAQGVAVQTASGERSGIVSSEQIQNLTVINRDFSVLVSLLPGVVDDPGAEVQSFTSNARFNVLGGRNYQNNITIDGMPTENSNGGNANTFISMDSVESVKIMVSNFQAEFGRKPGANIMAVSKSGSRQFHGNGYFEKRHEQFNAANFFNNRNSIPEPPYRFSRLGFNVSGPVYVPGGFNADRSKLFFFFSGELQGERRPQSIQQVTVPTELERQGDFSQSIDQNGKSITILDPLNARKAFPGNLIPKDRINSNMQKYLNLLPLPNYFDRTISAGRYNYRIQESLDAPKYGTTGRIDYILSTKTSIYGKYSYWYENLKGFGVPAANAKWGWLPNNYNPIAKTLTVSATHIFTNATILESSVGLQGWTESSLPGLRPEYVTRITRSTTGISIPQGHPENNPLNLVPQVSFGGGGLSNLANASYENRFPIHGKEVTVNWNGGFTRVHGSHTSKVGIYYERWFENKGPNGNFAGKFDFAVDSNNPNESNNTFANALLGNFKTYSESSTRPIPRGRVNVIEWYLQDNWRISRRLTLDFGVRLGWSQPFHSQLRDEAGFVPERFDPAKAVSLIRPDLSKGKRVGINPLTGQVLPQALIGAIAPGSGDPYDGTVDGRADLSYPAGLRNNSGIKAAPRIGFAWDPFGDGKSVVRGGIGLFYQVRDRDNYYMNVYSNPPIRLDPQIYYGTVDNFLTQTGYNFTSGTSGYDVNRPLERTANFSLGIQREVGFKTVVDLSYVGALGRHLVQRRNINSIPFGTTFLPSSIDPSNGKTLSSPFLRPYLGYGDINYSEYGGTSNYHSLQASANRRIASVNFGLSYTWSKAMDYVDSENSNVSSLIDRKEWNYGKAGFDRTHILKGNWMWRLPNASRAWSNAFTRTVLDDWTLSGITTFMSGAPMGVDLAWASGVNTDITGSPTDGARVLVVGNPVLPRSERSFDRFFNTSAFRAPVQGTYGNAPKDIFRGPGINNWDISIFKKIPLPSERVGLQMRCELYNAFNHTQFNDVDNTARFDAQGSQINPTFGQYSSARRPRRMLLALRLSF